MKKNDAKEISVRVLTNKLLDKIKVEALKGNFTLRADSYDAPKAVIDRLKELGYSVGNDEGERVITWEE